MKNSIVRVFSKGCNGELIAGPEKSSDGKAIVLIKKYNPLGFYILNLFPHEFSYSYPDDDKKALFGYSYDYGNAIISMLKENIGKKFFINHTDQLILKRIYLQEGQDISINGIKANGYNIIFSFGGIFLTYYDFAYLNGFHQMRAIHPYHSFSLVY